MTTVAAPVAPVRFRSPALRAAPQAGVDREARVIRGYAAITRGEALGHGLWIDSEFLDEVVKAGNARPNGFKTRFTHPGLCADGLGKYLGRTKNFRREGDRVLADLHLSAVADESPDGRLAQYVLDLAEEDPRAFGASIVFERDVDAEINFCQVHGADAESGFRSPDPLNAKNYRHARLARLMASDVVDEPAANPSGFFSSREELPARAEEALAYVLGLRDEISTEALGGIEPSRARQFFGGFLSRHGLSIAKGNVMPEEIKQQEVKPVPASLAELKSLGASPEFVLAQLEKGATLDEAKAALGAAELAALKAENEKLKTEAARTKTGAAPIGFQAPPAEGEKNFMQAARAYAAEHACSMTEAMRKLARTESELYERHVAASRVKKAG